MQNYPALVIVCKEDMQQQVFEEFQLHTTSEMFSRDRRGNLHALDIDILHQT